jgi:DNA helicase-2/ATP-dependent DNA helicase PcrA
MEQLNPAQLEAVLHKDGPLLIVAGAGTGKTHAITQKIGYMIEQGWAEPEEILALTFTEKASAEMEERVDRLLPMGYADLWISTFHGFTEKILKAHGLEIGLPTEFKLLNEFEQWRLIQKNLDRFDLSYYRPAGNPTKFIEALLRHFSRLKDENITPADYLAYTDELRLDFDGQLGKKAKGARGKVKAESSNKSKIELTPLQKLKLQMKVEEVTEEMLEQEVLRLSEVANAYHVYQQLLLEEGAMDFGDLINYCLKLFRERPLILARYQEQFKFILVDEFQDTNWSQYELVKLLAAKRRNLIVVGDDDQSIYRFRGASMSNILQFRTDYPEAHQVVLTENYRSQQAILDLSYEFIKLNNPNRLEAQSQNQESRIKNQGKKKQNNILNKQLNSNRPGAAQIEVLTGTNLEDEVRLVIQRIVDLKNGNAELSWSDFAILVRANGSAKEFCSVFDKNDIPYQFLASRGLYVKSVIMDVVAYLKLLDDYHESRAMYRVLNLPFLGFTYKELVDFNFTAAKKARSLFDTLRHADSESWGTETKKKIFTILSLISNHSRLAREKRTSEVVLAFMNESGYLKYLTGLSGRESQESLSYLNQFMKRIAEFEHGSDDKSVKTFLEELNMEIQAGEEGSLAPDMEIGPDTVKVMTVHASKGLEFEHVFIVNMVDKRFPAIGRKEAIAIPDALVKELVTEGDTHLEEERRLFYVAMTRAKAGLFFSWAPDYGGTQKKKPSRFLVEAGLVQDTKPENKKTKEQIGAEQFKQTDRQPKQQAEFVTIPKFFSYSQLAAFQNCPYQYRFAHILKIPMRGKGVFSFGKTMHSTLQKTFELLRERRGQSQSDLFGQTTKERQQVTLEEILHFYEESWIDEWYSSNKQKEEYRENGQRIIKEFYDLHKDNWPDNQLTEKGFNLKVVAGQEAYTVRGMIDRVDSIDGKKIKIIDYKTGNPKDKLTFEEKEQLLIYQIAAEEVFKEEVGGLAFYYLENNQEVEFLGTPAELDKVRGKIVETIEEIKKGDFTATPSPLCKYCDFFDICEFRQN